MKKRVISILLMIVLLASLIPTLALADGDEAEPGQEPVVNSEPAGEDGNIEPEAESGEQESPVPSQTGDDGSDAESVEEEALLSSVVAAARLGSAPEDAVARIGDTSYDTLEDALAAAVAGDTVLIVKADTYTVSTPVAAGVCIEGGVEGVTVNAGSFTDISFRNVAFTDHIDVSALTCDVSVDGCTFLAKEETQYPQVIVMGIAADKFVDLKLTQNPLYAAVYNVDVGCTTGKIRVDERVAWWNGNINLPYSIDLTGAPDYLRNNTDVTQFAQTGLDENITNPENYANTVTAVYDSANSSGDNLIFDLSATSDGVDVPQPFTSKVTFRLPVTVNYQSYALLKHTGDSDRIIDVKSNGNGKFVEISVDHFSPFGLSPMDDGDIVARNEDLAQSYTSLQDAFNDANDGNTITVKKDIAADAGFNVNKQVTLDLNGHFITPVSSLGSTPLVNVGAGGDLTLTDSAGNEGSINTNGSGSTNGSGNTAVAVTGGKLTVENGNIRGDVDAVSVDSGTAIINGGFLDGGTNALNINNSTDSAVTGGMLDGNVVSPNEKIITGGSFDREPDEDLIADGYCIKQPVVERYEVGEHKVVAADTDKDYCPHYVCRNCDTVYSDAEGKNPTSYDTFKHKEITDPDAKAATCETKGNTAGTKCEKCGHVITPPTDVAPLGHNWNSGRITKYPTPTTYGERTYTCQRCGKTAIEKIAPTNTPITGDSSNMVLWISMLGAALVGAAVVFIIYKKSKKS